MSRFRPAAPKSSPYITPEGYTALGEELQGLWARRDEVLVHLTAAAAEGDRSENAEYIYRKKQLREMDRRIGYLQRRMPVLKVVERSPQAAPSTVFFGATVELEDDDGNTVSYRIVGADEIDPTKNWISVDSPMARALLKRAPEDEVTVKAPTGERIYWVLGVSY